MATINVLSNSPWKVSGLLDVVSVRQMSRMKRPLSVMILLVLLPAIT